MECYKEEREKKELVEKRKIMIHREKEQEEYTDVEIESQKNSRSYRHDYYYCIKVIPESDLLNHIYQFARLIYFVLLR